jgi:hypothetical protein
MQGKEPAGKSNANSDANDGRRYWGSSMIESAALAHWPARLICATHARHFTPQYLFLCHMGLYLVEVGRIRSAGFSAKQPAGVLRY